MLREIDLSMNMLKKKKINHKKYGKFIIASNKTELPNLEAIFNQGKKNNVEISRVEKEIVLENNPGLIFHNALYSPNSGVIDVPEYVSALEGDIQHFGGLISLRTSFLSAKKTKDKFIVSCLSDEEFIVESKYLINCSGLSNEHTLKNIKGFPRNKIYKNFYAKGHYFKYSGKSPFSNLIYPVSGQHSLGIHVGFDLAGGMRFGPDVEFVKEIDYTFNESLKTKFINSITQYWPGINPEKLHPDYTGIRPKITKPNESMRDFSIQIASNHRIKNFINLQGIESPGLTSSLAIGNFVNNLL